MDKLIYNVRFPKMLHAQAMACAKAKGESLHSFILEAIRNQTKIDKEYLVPGTMPTSERPTVWSEFK